MSQDHTSLNADLDAVAALAGRLRRTLYEFVIGEREPVTRDAAAVAVGTTRQAAAYHLDHLVDEGLLDVRFERVNGRVGPGAGRTSKLYMQSSRAVEVSLPPRRYELASRIMLQAIAKSPLTRQSLTGVAREIGAEVGKQGFDEALRDLGYQPVEVDGVTRFRNCPFDALRQMDQDTTCDLNLALVEGVLDGSGADRRAELAPEVGYCCIRLHATKEEPT